MIDVINKTAKVQKSFDTILDYMNIVSQRGEYERLLLEGVPEKIKLAQELLCRTDEWDTKGKDAFRRGFAREFVT